MFLTKHLSEDRNKHRSAEKNTLPAGTSSSQGRCQHVANDTRAINACLHWSPESCKHACLWSYESVLLSCDTLPSPFPSSHSSPRFPKTHASATKSHRWHYGDCPSAPLLAQRAGQGTIVFHNQQNTVSFSKENVNHLQEESTNSQGKRLEVRRQPN